MMSALPNSSEFLRNPDLTPQLITHRLSPNILFLFKMAVNR